MLLNKSINENSVELNDLCISLAEIGGKYSLKHYKEQVLVTTKKDKSFVTQIDLDIENKLKKIVQSKFPEHNIFGEENEQIDHNSDYTWYIDPIDGTSNFIFGVPLFGSSVALKYKDQIVCSAIYLPVLELLINAKYQKGLFINGKKYNFIEKAELSKTTLVVDCGKTEKARIDYATFLTENAQKFRSIRQFGCVSSHAILLNGNNLNVSMIIDAPVHDLYPLSLIYKEAGFKLLNRLGDEWDTNSSDLIACKPELSSEVINCLKSTRW